MQTGDAIRFDFSAGELGPTLAGRFDLQQYESGCARIENAVCQVQGGLTKMPGTRFLGESAHGRVLFPFIYDDLDAYIIEFGETTRIWGRDGQLHETIDGTTIYDADSVRDIQMAGKDNWRIVVAKGKPPRKLEMDLTTKEFTLEEVTWIGKDFNVLMPRAVAYFQERLHFAEGSTVHGSKTGDYDANRDFTIPVSDAAMDDAYEYTIGGADANEILWMNAYGTLIAATSSAEYTMEGMSGIGIAEIRPQSTYGTSKIQGRLYGDSVIFLQRHGRKAREYIYTDRNSPYMGTDLTLFAPHIMEPGIVQTAFFQDPMPVIWFVRSDGQMVGLTRDRTVEVQGYHRHITQGKYLSAAVIPGDGHDQLWVLVEREIEDTSVVYLERFESFSEVPLADCFYVHSGITQRDDVVYEVVSQDDNNPLTFTVSPTPTTVDVGSYLEVRDGLILRIESITGDQMTMGYSDGSGDFGTSEDFEGALIHQVWERVDGLDHLEGEEVAILADGGIHARKVVTSGEVPLDRWSRVTTVGLSYRALAETMPGLVGQTTRMVRMDARFYRTVGCQMGDSEDNLREMLWLVSGEDVYLGPAPITTGDKRDIFPGVTKRTESFVVANDYPLPWTVLALSIQASVSTGA